MSDENAVLAMAGLDVEEKPAETAEPETKEPETKEPEAEGDNKAETEPEKEEVKEDSPPESTDDKPKGIDPQHAAMLAKANDHKEKWQQAQQRADDLQKQLDALNKQPAPDPLENPEGFAKYQQDQISELQKDFGTQLANAKYEMARVTVMSLKDDYEEVEAVFIKEAESNPTLARMLGESANPALFAYEQGKRIQALSVDPETMREQIRAEERAKIEAELKGVEETKSETQAQIDRALKPSLATEGGAGLESEPSVDINTVGDMTGEDALSRTRKR